MPETEHDDSELTQIEDHGKWIVLDDVVEDGVYRTTRVMNIDDWGCVMQVEWGEVVVNDIVPRPEPRRRPLGMNTETLINAYLVAILSQETLAVESRSIVAFPEIEDDDEE